MAQKIQRNALCPCGSGKKYKKCCMIQARDQMLAAMHRRDGVLHALDWVSKHYSAQTDQWVDDVWLAGLSEQQRQGIASADARIRTIHDMNLLEYLVAEGQYNDMEGENKPLQLIFQATDLDLDDAQRAYLQQLSEQPLRLYQVVACVAGESFNVRDMLQQGSTEIVLADSYASRMLDVNDVVGLRIMQTPTGQEVSGSIYHIPEDYVDALLQEMRHSEHGADGENNNDDFGVGLSVTLIHYWLKLVADHV